MLLTLAVLIATAKPPKATPPSPPVAAAETSPQAPTFTEAVAYNDWIVARQDELAAAMAVLFAKIDGHDRAEILAEHARLVETGKRLSALIKTLAPFERETELRDAAIGLFGFYERVLAVEYGELIAILVGDKTFPGEAAQQARLKEILDKVTAEEGPYDVAFEKAQQGFAAKYNIQLAPHGPPP